VDCFGYRTLAREQKRVLRVFTAIGAVADIEVLHPPGVVLQIDKANRRVLVQGYHGTTTHWYTEEDIEERLSHGPDYSGVWSQNLFATYPH
jgi:hypothetical protein